MGRLTGFFVFYISLLILFSSEVRAQEHKAILKDRGEIYFRFDAKNFHPDQLSSIFSIDKISGDSIYAYANSKEFEDFLELKMPYDILPVPSMPSYIIEMADQHAVKSSWNTYPTYPAYESMMNDFQQNYPNLCRLDTLGTLPSGRRILALRITDNPDSTEAEPQFFYTSSMHGDELVGYVLMLRLADYLLSGYGTDPVATRIIDSVDLWINPLANPDGAYRNSNYTVFGSTRYNANWVDLNRNFHDPEDGLHPDGNAWQPETVIFMDFAEQYNLSMSCNIHGGAEVCNYPWDTWSRLAADNSWWVYVCNEYADTAQAYSPGGYLDDFGTGITNGYAWYTTSGNRQDHMNFFHHCREFTLEVSNQKLPSASSLPLYWNYNYRSLINYIEQSLNGLNGNITDSLSGLPLRAKVYINGHDLDSSHVYSTLSTGQYYRYLPSGTYAITFSAPGYQTKTINNVSVVMGQAQVLDVQLVPDQLILEGQMVYNNAALDPLPGVKLNLLDTNGFVLDSTITDSAGNFEFILSSAGTYLLVTYPNLSWNSINSTDALLIAQHFAQIGAPLEGQALEAADVNSSGFVNATDALLVLRRFVGLDSSFAAGDWVGDEVQIQIAGDMNLLFKMLLVGDTDKSYTP